MLYSEQEEQTLNSEETPSVEQESMESSETEVDSADSSLESKDEEQVEPESVELSELASTDAESTDLESEPSDEEQVEPEPAEASEPASVEADSPLESPDEEQAQPEPVEVSELASTDAESTDLESEPSDEEQVEPEPAEASEPASVEPDSTVESPDEEHAEPDETIAEIESPEAETEITKEETEQDDLELTGEQPTPTKETEPSLSDVDTTDTALKSLEEGQSSEFDQDGRSWFVVHCYSGYENKVRHNLEQRIETMGMKDKIFDIVVPTEEEIEVKEGKRRTVERRVFPGYILVNMVMTEESWYVVRNTPGVTGFVGMGNTPTPLRPEEVAQIIKRMEAEAPRIKVTFKSGERVRIVDGPFNDFRGTVAEIDMERAKVRVMVNFFGRETPVELDFLQVEKT
jgi:transcriptional antiterminator NusG